MQSSLDRLSGEFTGSLTFWNEALFCENRKFCEVEMISIKRTRRGRGHPGPYGLT